MTDTAKMEVHDPLDGWCNFHQDIHEEDRGRDACPNRHAHMDPDRGLSMFEIWMRDNPECWAIVTPNRVGA
tara:strand:+ start:1030 stop:1242 length:213 start_codon:yes stop_codon:yes gene_type:complete